MLIRLDEIGDRLTAIENLLAEMRQAGGPGSGNQRPAGPGSHPPASGSPRGAQRKPPAGGARAGTGGCAEPGRRPGCAAPAAQA